MSAIYDAISDLMDSCVKELRKSNKIDTSELTLEQGLLKSFDDIVRRQLDSVWNTVSPKTKQVTVMLLSHVHCHHPQFCDNGIHALSATPSACQNEIV